MSRHPILICVGTRPEAIKMAPIVLELQRRGVPHLLVSTGQHREMLEQALQAFALIPNIDLRLMKAEQGLAELSSRALSAVDEVIAATKPRALLVQGDTATAFCAALAGFYRQVPVGHVEAGLRTDRLDNPFPEEGNRRLIGRLATWHFCPTAIGAENLLRENVAPESIYVTGNTVIDAALHISREITPRRSRTDGRREVLVTMHRRETQGDAQAKISQALSTFAERDDVHLTFPVHLSPAVRASVLPALENHPNVTLREPLDYRSLIEHLARVDLVITDSGGLQEEAPAFNVPVLVMRETTERPEGVTAGCSLLCGTGPERIIAEANRILDDGAAYAAMARAINPYGDGSAAARILDAMELSIGQPSLTAS